MAVNTTYTWREVVEAILPLQGQKFFLKEEERKAFYLKDVSQDKIIVYTAQHQEKDLYKSLRSIVKIINEEGKLVRKKPKNDVVRDLDYSIAILRGVNDLFGVLDSPSGDILEIMYNPLREKVYFDQTNITTLFIIGNGFDKFNKLNTGYWDFHEWLKGQPNGEDFIEALEEIFTLRTRKGHHLLWTDFEKAISKCDIERCFAEAEAIYEEEKDELYTFIRDVDDYIMNRIVSPLTIEMPKFFKGWIKDINAELYKRAFITTVSDKLIKFNRNGLFLTFNFTDTLEHLYHIPEYNVCHIHNRISTNEEPIVGHNSRQGEINKPIEITQGEINLKLKIATTIANLNKQHSQNIKKHTDFFDRLGKHINKVVVYGHSMNDIDIPYFKSVRNRIATDAQWYVSYHNDDDYKMIEIARRTLKIEPPYFHPFELKNDN